MICRYQEDGVQDQAMARALFLLLCVQDTNRNQEFHPSWTGDLLCWLLRGEIRNSLCQVQQGMIEFVKLKENDIRSLKWKATLHIFKLYYSCTHGLVDNSYLKKQNKTKQSF